MGRRGPAPQPSALRELRGNPGRRAPARAEPRPEQDAQPPRAPNGLGRVANRTWRELATALHTAGLLTQVDEMALRVVCELWEEYLALGEQVRQEGATVENERGAVYLNPAAGQLSAVRRDLLRWMQQFGMTPSARTALRIEQQERQLSLAELLFKAVGE